MIVTLVVMTLMIVTLVVVVITVITVIVTLVVVTDVLGDSLGILAEVGVQVDSLPGGVGDRGGLEQLGQRLVPPDLGDG